MRTKKVQFKNKGNREKKEQEKIDKLTRKLLQLNVKNDTYIATYTQLFVLAPNMIDNLLSSTYFGASTMAAISTTGMLSYSRYPQSSTPISCDFFYYFCKRADYWLRTYPTAEEYIQL